MLIFVYGGSGSGKSAFAEDLCVKLCQGKKMYYIASMENTDSETDRKIKRHQKARSGRNFETIECPVGLKNVKLKERTTVIIECLSNLAANEMFSEKGCKKNVVQNVVEGVKNIAAQSENVVIVSNDIFGGGNSYDRLTLEYMRVLGDINYILAALCQEAVEVVCSVPVYYKKRGLHD